MFREAILVRTLLHNFAVEVGREQTVSRTGRSLDSVPNQSSVTTSLGELSNSYLVSDPWELYLTCELQIHYS